MRVRFVSMVVMLALFFLPVLSYGQPQEQVVVYNWTEFIPDDVLQDFEKETGIKVLYSTFDSNEAMFSKIKVIQGKGYDVIVPSSYYVRLMANEKLIQTLDLKKVPNFLKHASSNWLCSFDNHSIPYMWGSLGLAYNTKFIPKGSITKWSDLLKPELKGKVMFTSDQRDAFGVAALVTGTPINAPDETTIQRQFEWLMQLKPSVKVWDSELIKQNLVTEEVWISPIWDGDYLMALPENSDLEFVFPEEGVVLWVDSFVISAGASNIEGAYKFINYMMRPEVSERCMEEYHYISPLQGSVDNMKEGTLLIPPDKFFVQDNFIKDVGNRVQLYNRYWEKLKTD